MDTLLVDALARNLKTVRKDLFWTQRERVLPDGYVDSIDSHIHDDDDEDDDVDDPCHDIHLARC